MGTHIDEHGNTHHYASGITEAGKWYCEETLIEPPAHPFHPLPPLQWDEARKGWYLPLGYVQPEPFTHDG